MLNVKELSLDLGKRTSNQHVIIAQGDTNGTTIEATIYDHGVRLQDAGLEAYFVMLLPDNEHYVRDAATYDAGVITYTVNEAYAAAVEGYTPTAYFELRDGITTVATTERFGVTVEECAYDGLEPAESWDSAIAQLVIDGAEAVNAVEDALDTLVDQEQSMLTGATATVDATTGTPSVTVTMGEPQEGGRSANFAFGGIKGEDGERGQQGADGYSPTVNISSTTDEHIVTITDAQGAHTYSVPTYADEEQARANAETARSNAESARASEWATIKAEAEDATSAAETATSDANAAASDATAAAAEARAASAATWLSGNVLFGELSEAAVLTTDDAYAAPPKGVEVYGKSTQAGTPTPDAPVEIKSVDDLTLVIHGVNMLNLARSTIISHVDDTQSTAQRDFTEDQVWLSLAPNNYFNNGAVPTEYQVTDTTVSYTSKAIAGYGLGFPCRCLPNTKYYLKCSNSSAFDTSDQFMGIGFYDANGNYINYTSNISERMVTTPNNCRWLTVIMIGRTINTAYTFTKPQLEAGTVATQYQPYQGASVSIPLSDHVGRSLPDGTRDTLTLSYIGPSTEHEGWGVFRKVLTQNVGEVSLDGTQSWWYSASGTYTRFGCSSILLNACTPLTDKLTYYLMNDLLTHPYGINALTDNRIYVSLDESITTGAQAKAWFAENPVTMQYTLATPVTYDLGTVELPVNPAPDLTAWADGGSAQPNMSMEYERDVNIALVMERDKAMAEIAPLETSPTKANHSVGTYLMYDGTLYKVTRAIASGEQITPGTNVTATTVAAELLALA